MEVEVKNNESLGQKTQENISIDSFFEQGQA